MITIIAGPRTATDPDLVAQAVAASGFNITEVVSGRARGIDTFGEHWAEDHGIPVTPFEADWTKYGRSAGPIRNQQMAAYAEGLLAIWDGQSKGTKNMIETMKKLGKPVFIHYF